MLDYPGRAPGHVASVPSLLVLKLDRSRPQKAFLINGLRWTTMDLDLNSTHHADVGPSGGRL